MLKATRYMSVSSLVRATHRVGSQSGSVSIVVEEVLSWGGIILQGSNKKGSANLKMTG